MNKQEEEEKLTLQEDPAQVQNFLTDEDNNCFFLDDKVKMLCIICKRQYKHRDGWIYCPNSCDE